MNTIYRKIFFIIISYKLMICLHIEEPRAFVRCIFMSVLHLCDTGAKLHGSLGQDGCQAEAQLLGC